MSQPENQKPTRTRYALNLTIIGIFGQVGFLTLAIVFIALFGGLWLDKVFDTKPIITIALMCLSMPIALFLMYKVVMWATSRIAPVSTEKKESPEGGSSL